MKTDFVLPTIPRIILEFRGKIVDYISLNCQRFSLPPQWFLDRMIYHCMSCTVEANLVRLAKANGIASFSPAACELARVKAQY